MRVRLLGPVDVTVGGAPYPFTGLRRKSVLAVLALQPGEVVGTERLIDAVWGDDPPATAANTLQRHISFLRQALRGRHTIVARPPGYLLDLPVEAVDAGQAGRLLHPGGHDGDLAGRAARLRAALRLWRGPSLFDVTEVAWLRNQAQRLDEIRLDAVERLAEARLALGEHVALVAELEELIERSPFREHVYRLLMLALYRSGRQAAALAVYHRLRRLLGDELGIEPSSELRDLEAAILRQDPALDSAPPVAQPQQAGRVRVVPAQLPRAVGAFTGRDEELAWLHRHTPPYPGGRGPAPAQGATVLVVSGTAGVGKTALAVHWAHHVAERFPDGQLYVDLRGFDPGGVVMDPVEAVDGFLDALGVPGDQVPASAQARAGLYRSVLAGKRVLVVADNARDEQQVRTLLPGTPGSMVVVTSRNQLPGLVAAEAAHPLTLGLPSFGEARRFLANRLGARRVDAEPQAVEDIVARCARLPLALAVAAARAAMAPALPLADLAAQLRDAAATLDPFDGADPATSIRAVFSWSYHALGAPAARLFRLLGLCPGPDIAPLAAAGLAGLRVREVQPLLAELTRAHLLTETRPGRFGMHELLRAYAVEQAHGHDGDEEQAAARRRFLDHHLHTAHAAALRLARGRDPIELSPPAPGVTVQPLADLQAAQAWFASERDVLLAVVARPPDGFDRHTWQLAWALGPFLCTGGYWRDNQRVQRAALRAARRLGDEAGQAHAHSALAKIHDTLGDVAEAEQHTRTALRLFGHVGNKVALAATHRNLGVVAERRGDIRLALTHCEDALQLYRSIGHALGQAYTGTAIGEYHGLLGDPVTGLAYCREALDAFLTVDDLAGAAAAWDVLGGLHFRTHDTQEGERCYQQALALWRRLGDRFMEVTTQANLADSRQRAGDADAAHQARRLVLAVLHELEPDAAAQVRSRLDVAPAPAACATA
ncbi:hypothetical protein MPTA5024_01865 [Microbispora sp. ATCC PTA-5024]|nr:hypothetical protein MPTA5024_01865 [Microbispora sp. ATCC PTA-5024]